MKRRFRPPAGLSSSTNLNFLRAAPGSSSPGTAALHWGAPVAAGAPGRRHWVPVLGSDAAAYSGYVDFYLVAVALFAVLIWSFRYLWLYVPIALDYRADSFLKRIPGFIGSFRLIGLWMLCFMPVLFLLFVMSSLN